jgi:hypothetical protein
MNEVGLASQEAAEATHLEVGKEGLLVEGGRGKAEGVDNVVDLLLAILEILLGLLSGTAGTNVG